MQNEYNFQEEAEWQREKERDWTRQKWDVSQKRFDKWRRRAYDQLNQLDEPPPLSSKDGTHPQHSSGEGRDSKQCPGLQPEKGFQPYPKFRANAPQKDYAYVTFVSSSEFVMAAAVLMYSIAVSNSQYARAVCVTIDVSRRDRDLLAQLAEVVEIEKIPSPLYVSNPRYRDVFTKLRIWQLAMYSKVVYIDTDVIVVKNMDELFDLPEWSVPMDAEQDRFSTGMMVLEPKLKTFDDMMTKLKETRVSMELPDLLFLKEYFTAASSSGGGRVNIIPRWYQVYQEEFGSEYSTYLTKRQQRITIFDPRIHGIHYPGEAKPWKKFETKMQRYSSGFCSWWNADEFKYDPQFLWYLRLAQLKLALAQAARSTTFDFERSAEETKLADYVAGRRRRRRSRRHGRQSGTTATTTMTTTTTTGTRKIPQQRHHISLRGAPRRRNLRLTLWSCGSRRTAWRLSRARLCTTQTSRTTKKRLHHWQLRLPIAPSTLRWLARRSDATAHNQTRRSLASASLGPITRGEECSSFGSSGVAETTTAAQRRNR